MKKEKYNLLRWILVAGVTLFMLYLIALYYGATMFEGLHPPSEVNDNSQESTPVDSSLM